MTSWLLILSLVFQLPLQAEAGRRGGQRGSRSHEKIRVPKTPALPSPNLPSGAQAFQGPAGEMIQGKSTPEGILLTIKDAEGKVSEILISKSEASAIAQASPEALRAIPKGQSEQLIRQSIKKGFKDSLIHFPMEALSFYTAMAAMAVYECWISMRSNPMACSDFGKQMIDPVAHVSFYLFIATNKSLGNYVNALNFNHFQNTGRFLVPRTAIPFMGMAAGSFVSSIAYDMWTDPNVAYVRKHFFSTSAGLGTKIDNERFKEALSKAFSKWANPANLGAYAPHAIALLAAFATTSLTVGGAKWVAKKAGYNPIYREWAKGKIKTTIQTGRSMGAQGVRAVTKLPILKLGLRLGGFALTVGSIIHFFTWEHYIGPPVTKWWNQEETAMKLRYHESKILDLIASARNQTGTNAEYLRHYNRLLKLHVDGLHNDNDIQKQSLFISAVAGEFGYDPQTQEELKSVLSENKNKSFIGRNAPYQNDISPTLTQVPFLLDTDTVDTFSQMPNFAFVVEEGHEGVDLWLFSIDGARAKTRYDLLMEHLKAYQQELDSYNSALASAYESSRAKWEEFFKPFLAWSLTTYRLYRHLIEHKDKVKFEKEDFWRSKALIDALHLNSRPLDNAAGIETRRLLDENKLIQMGFERELIYRQSDNNLRVLVSKLWNETTWYLTDPLAGKQPTGYRLELVEHLNRGFPVTNINSFSKYDFQIRNKANAMGIKVERLNPHNTDKIEEIVEFLEKQEDWNQPYFVFAMNSGWTPEQVFSSNVERISQHFGGEQQTLALMEDLALNEENRRISKSTLEGVEILSQGSEFYDEDLSLGTVNLLNHGVAYQSTVEKILIDAACGKTVDQLGSDLAARDGFLFFLGSLKFQAPKLVARSEKACSNIYTRSSHKRFYVDEGDQEKTYHNLLDYVVRNIPADLTVEKFDKEWWPRVLSFTDEVYRQYQAKEKVAFDSRLSKAVFDQSYGRFLKLNLITSVNGGINRSDISVLHPILTAKTDSFISRKDYANGLQQSAIDSTDYLLRVLASMLPHDDPAFTKDLYEKIEDITDLSVNLGSQYENLMKNPNWNAYTALALQEAMDKAQGVSTKNYVNTALRISMYRAPDYHKAVLATRLSDLNRLISNRLLIIGASNNYSRAITNATEVISEIILSTVTHASTMEFMTKEANERMKLPSTSEESLSEALEEVTSQAPNQETSDSDTSSESNTNAQNQNETFTPMPIGVDEENSI